MDAVSMDEHGKRITGDDSERTPIRTVRIGDELWDRAAACAASEGTSRSQLIRRLLHQYMRGRF